MTAAASETPLFTSPLSAVRVITAQQSRPRFVWLGAAATAVARWVQEALLIVLGLAAFTVAAFQLHTIAGWAVAGLALLILDWSRRDGDRRRAAS